MQTLDYERILFHYIWCKKMGHLASQYLMKPTTKCNIYKKQGHKAKDCYLKKPLEITMEYGNKMEEVLKVQIRCIFTRKKVKKQIMGVK